MYHLDIAVGSIGYKKNAGMTVRGLRAIGTSVRLPRFDYIRFDWIDISFIKIMLIIACVQNMI